MGGLLYKDFAAVRGKRLVFILTIATVIFVILRMLFPGTGENHFFMGTNENGESVNMIDMFFFYGEFCILWCGGFWINGYGARILELDDKNRIRGYLSALPVSKKTYVASKYIFLGICSYMVFSLYMIWHIISAAFMQEGQIVDMSYLLSGFSVLFICFILMMEAVELPLFLLMGKEKAMMVRVSFWLILAMAVIGFLLFGDLNALESWDIKVWIDWADYHGFELVLLNIVSPVIVLGIYYLSYQLSAHLYERKEKNDE